MIILSLEMWNKEQSRKSNICPDSLLIFHTYMKILIGLFWTQMTVNIKTLDTEVIETDEVIYII